MSHHAVAQRVLDAELRNAKVEFRQLLHQGTLIGGFSDPVWNYRGRKLSFSAYDRKRAGGDLQGWAGILARCFVVRCAKGGVASKESIYSKLLSFRALATVLADERGDWCSIKRSQVDRAQAKFQDYSVATRYHRGNALASVIDYVNRLAHKVSYRMEAFSRRTVRWSHGIPNPTHESADVTSARHAQRRARLYKPGLEIALGKARWAARQHVDKKRRLSYHLIRLEALVFSLGLGLRVGELVSLPLNALEQDDDGNSYFLRVPTEKNERPRAVGVPDIWVPAFVQAYTYLLEECAGPRKRARDIEENGFDFVVQQLRNLRDQQPLDEGKRLQISSIGLDPATHFTVSECVKALQISTKELVHGGRFYDVRVELPRLVAARIATWMDRRVDQWDWHEFAVTRFSEKRLPLAEVAARAGISAPTTHKATWFAADLRTFLKDLKEAGCLEPSSRSDAATSKSLAARWSLLRRKMLARRGGGGGVSCVVVSQAKLIEKLTARYSEILTRHFSEFFDHRAVTGGGRLEARNARRGVPPKLSDHLLVIWEGEFSDRKNRGLLPRAVSRSDFYNYLAANNVKATCFEVFNIRDHDGRPFSFSPHAIRRWLTTALLRSGVSETACDVWMGRTVGQTRQYDYRTAAERAEHARSRYTPGREPNDFLGRKVRFWREEGVSEQEIKSLITEKLKVLHYTPWGACSKELYVSPCQRGLMCLRGFDGDGICPSFHVDPSDDVARRAIISLKEKYQMQLRVVGEDLAVPTQAIMSELNSTETVDQHLEYMVSVVRGCEEALKMYET